MPAKTTRTAGGGIAGLLSHSALKVITGSNAELPATFSLCIIFCFILLLVFHEKMAGSERGDPRLMPTGKSPVASPSP